MLEMLLTQMPAREAALQLDGITVALSPHLKTSDLRSLIRRLERRADSTPTETPDPMEKIAHDPEAARAWFVAHGIVTAGDHHDGQGILDTDVPAS